MAKSLKETSLSTRSARARLSAGVYWRGIDPDVHLGYRRSLRGGRWLVRWYAGEQKYRQLVLGTADDEVSEGTLSYEMALRSARDAVSAARRAVDPVDDDVMPTVRDVVLGYVALRDARAAALAGRPVKSDANSSLGLYVLRRSKLAAKNLCDVTENDLRDWRSSLPAKLKPVTRQRTATNLKAALNAAYRRYRKRLPGDFAETIRQGLSTADEGSGIQERARENQILTDDEVRAIIAKSAETDPDGDLMRLIILLAATGSRFSQLARMRVGDVQFEHGRLLVPTSRKGKGRIDGFTPIRVGIDVLTALRPACEGRKDSDPLLCRWRHKQTGPATWKRDRRGPWTSSSEMLRPWNAVCAAAGLPGVIPYALRHSSIVRGIRAGLPIRLVAALHDTSVVMIERHYSRWITDGLDELAARAIIDLIADPAARLAA